MAVYYVRDATAPGDTLSFEKTTSYGYSHNGYQCERIALMSLPEVHCHPVCGAGSATLVVGRVRCFPTLPMVLTVQRLVHSGLSVYLNPMDVG